MNPIDELWKSLAQEVIDAPKEDRLAAMVGFQEKVADHYLTDPEDRAFFGLPPRAANDNPCRRR